MKYTDFAIEKLGTPTIASPVKNLDFVRDDANVVYHNDIRDICDLLESTLFQQCFLQPNNFHPNICFAKNTDENY